MVVPSASRTSSREPGRTAALETTAPPELSSDRSLMRKPFPYGPFMVIGALIGLVWGPTIAAALWG